MARYADIDVLLEHLNASDEGNLRTTITQWLEMHQVEDVAPVVHAHWRENEEFPVYNCSNCCDAVPWAWVDNYMIKRCPFCGAKMDEEE